MYKVRLLTIKNYEKIRIFNTIEQRSSTASSLNTDIKAFHFVDVEELFSKLYIFIFMFYTFSQTLYIHFLL